MSRLVERYVTCQHGRHARLRLVNRRIVARDEGRRFGTTATSFVLADLRSLLMKLRFNPKPSLIPPNVSRLAVAG